MAKKTWRILVGMQCKECKKVTHFTSINKTVTAKLELPMYCKQCKRHTVHTSREKLK